MFIRFEFLCCKVIWSDFRLLFPLFSPNLCNPVIYFFARIVLSVYCFFKNFSNIGNKLPGDFNIVFQYKISLSDLIVKKPPASFLNESVYFYACFCFFIRHSVQFGFCFALASYIFYYINDIHQKPVKASIPLLYS